jgi:hypothetical protein
MQSTAHRVRRLRQLSSTHAQGRLDYYKEWFGVAEWRLPGRHFDPLNFRLWGRPATVTLDLFLKGRFLTPFCRPRLTASRHQNLKVIPAAACSTHDAAGAAPHIQRWTSVSDA